MKKKHLQFNDITAPSLARRAARRGAEKGESGRMEPGVINVFFSVALQEAAPNSSYSFQSPFLPHLFLLFSSLAHTFLLFVGVQLSIILLWKRAFSCHSSFANMRFSKSLWVKNAIRLAVGPPCLSVSVHPPPPLSIFIKVQKMLGTIKQIKSQCSGLKWGPAVRDDLEREPPRRLNFTGTKWSVHPVRNSVISLFSPCRLSGSCLIIEG